MGAKQQLLGLPDDRLPPTMTFGPRRWNEGVSSRAEDEGCCLSPCTHSPLGLGCQFSPFHPRGKASP